MYCKIYGIANGAILKKKNVCKILVELYSAILVRFSIFSIQVALIEPVNYYGILVQYVRASIGQQPHQQQPISRKFFLPEY